MGKLSYQAKHSNQGYGCSADLSHCLLRRLRVSRDFGVNSSLPGIARETPLQMEAFFINVNKS